MEKTYFSIAIFALFCLGANAQYVANSRMGEDSSSLSPLASSYDKILPNNNSSNATSSIQLSVRYYNTSEYSYAATAAYCNGSDKRLAGGALISTTAGSLGYVHSSTPVGINGWQSDCYGINGNDVLCATYVLCEK